MQRIRVSGMALRVAGGVCLVLCVAGTGAAVGQSGSASSTHAGTLPASAALVGMTRQEGLALGRADTVRFYGGEANPLWRAMSERMKAAVKSDAALSAMASKIKGQFGAETAVLHEDALPAPGGLMVYTRIVRYARYPAPMVVVFAFGGGGGASGAAGAVIEGFSIRPEPNAAATNFLGYKDKTALAFPLKGDWTIYQGGADVAENYHAAAPDERFAYDIVRIKDSRLYATDGKTNEDWYGFGQPVMADAAGKVVVAIDDYDDNPPMQPSETNPKFGNSVVIDHGDGEFSMYAHLRRGSVKVKMGERVAAGQGIGETGNSGNSPFTHLHYHLQTTSEWFNGLGLPVQFGSLMVDGKMVKGDSPVRGDDIAN